MRLNIGGGTNPLPGYTIIDRSVGKEAYPLDYPDNSIEEIRASHILEHFSHNETIAVLMDWTRVLQPRGVLKIAVPDFDWIVSVYRSHANQQAPYQWKDTRKAENGSHND